MADMTLMVMLFIILAPIGVFDTIYVQDANAASSCRHHGSDGSKCLKNDHLSFFLFLKLLPPIPDLCEDN